MDREMPEGPTDLTSVCFSWTKCMGNLVELMPSGRVSRRLGLVEDECLKALGILSLSGQRQIKKGAWEIYRGTPYIVVWANSVVGEGIIISSQCQRTPGDDS